MPQKKLTMRDIARIAQVSHMTVSRVLNNDPNVSRETRARVMEVVNRFNYRPDARARALSANRSNLIGLVVSDISNPFYAELALGIEEQARERGYNVVFCSTKDSPERRMTYTASLLNAGVDGMIFASSRLREPVVEDLIEEGFPLVLVNRKLEAGSYNLVACDNVKGAFALTRHLVSLGYKKIALITASMEFSTAADRLEGYTRALIESGLEIRDEFIVIDSFTREAGYEGARRLLSLEDPPEAVFGGNDFIAMGIFDAVGEIGLRIPEDLAVVGFDDTLFASNPRNALTTVSQRKYEMGRIAVRTLVDFIEREDEDHCRQVVLEPRLVIRESCGWKIKRKMSAA